VHPLKFILLAPFKLMGALLVALGYLVGFLLGAGLVGGGTALTMTGAGAVLGVPAVVIGVLVLRELFEDRSRHAVQESRPEARPPEAPVASPHAGGYWTPAAAAPVPAGAWAPAQPPRVHGHAPHYSPRPQYYWLPGRWTVR